MTNINDLAIVILAAGSSKRMGTSKQLLPIGSTTLLEQSINVAKASKIQNVNVVLGANSEEHLAILKHTTAHVFVNSEWNLGMGNTLKYSVRRILAENINTQGILFMVCDQPLLTSDHLNLVIDKYLEEEPFAVASSYGDTTGVPALFDRNTFSQLVTINDAEGAKAILKKIQNSLVLVEFIGGEVDLDTKEDYQRFINKI